MALTNNLTSFSTVLAKLPQQKIAQAISLLLLIYIAFLAAKITWLFVPQEQAINSTTIHSKIYKKQTASNYNLSALQALNLFGQYNSQVEEVVEQVQNAPQTRLQLTLSAAVASDSSETAAAIIEHKGKQETYGIGDIIIGTRASLEQVLIDRVIIKQSGRLETLMLDGADYNQPAKGIVATEVENKPPQRKNKMSDIGPKQQNIVDQRLNKELSKSAVKLRADLSENPGKITDYLRISPARENGAIVGYRLSPGKNPEFFKLSGLKAGDVAVQMNGYDLLTPVEAAQAMSALKTERDISLLVNRNNDLVEILFSID
ncbi:MAG: type II secretion system protein GspC [Colwellia sp.]|nr:type II secretion system protein GspC [Colwellia sp.]MCW9081900.1 type II secretion system protein GspC [Colwellia sp.]